MILTTHLTQSERQLLIELAEKYRALGNEEAAKRCLEKALGGATDESS